MMAFGYFVQLRSTHSVLCNYYMYGVIDLGPGLDMLWTYIYTASLFISW